MSTPNTWYTKAGSLGQEIVIDETTGSNIAVIWDAKHTPLVASAPEMLEALKEVADMLEEYRKTGFITGWDKPLKNARAAIAKATT